MSSKWEEMLQGLVKTAGTAGLKELDDALEKIEKEADTPWKKALLQLAGDAVEKYGPMGLRKIDDLIYRMGKGKDPDLSFASLKARSDYLAALQNMEADEKSKARDFFSTIGQSLGIILKAIIGGLTGK